MTELGWNLYYILELLVGTAHIVVFMRTKTWPQKAGVIFSGVMTAIIIMALLMLKFPE